MPKRKHKKEMLLAPTLEQVEAFLAGDKTLKKRLTFQEAPAGICLKPEENKAHLFRVKKKPRRIK